MKTKSVVNLNSDVYYRSTYWNDIPLVFEYMSENFTGDKKVWWVDDFKRRYAKKPFEHGLFLNCGDGRHEIEFYDKKIIKRITAFDVSPDLIKTARKGKGGRNINFFVGDANKIKFKNNEFDLVVNIAALHHVQFLNRLCRILANCLRPEGVFVNFEYIGPHRNQYPPVQWLLISLIQRHLPKKAKREKFGYPHVPTMLVTDPTEAIHSELIRKTIARYFRITERHDTNGGIAYELLTHNENIFKLSKKGQKETVERILYLDRLLTRLRLVPPLFTYFIAKSEKEVLKNDYLVKEYQKSEDEREFEASRLDGTYRLIDYVRLIVNCKNTRDRIYMIIKYFKVKVNIAR